MKRPLAVGLVLFVFTLATAGQTSRPAPPSTADAARARSSLFRKAMNDAQAQATGKPADAKVAAFYAAMADYMSHTNEAERGFADVGPWYASGGRASAKALLASADAAAAAGADAALLNDCKSVLLPATGRSAVGAATLARAIPGMTEGHYPALLIYEAAERGFKMKGLDRDIVPRANAAREPALTRLVSGTFASDAEAGAVYELVAQPFRQRYDPDARRRVLDAVDAAAGHNEWMAAMLRGADEVELAWQSRGAGWASTVTPDGAAGFDQHLALARKALTHAYDLAPGNPAAAALMITVCMGGSTDDDSCRVWFDRAVAVQPDYRVAWRNYGGNALLPRWGGSHSEMYRLGCEGMRGRRFDTQAPMFLIESLRDIVDDTGSFDVLKTPGVWTNAASVYDGYADRPADQAIVGPDPAWMNTQKAAFACRCGQYAEAAKILAALGDHAVPAAIDWLDYKLPELREEVAAGVASAKP